MTCFTNLPLSWIRKNADWADWFIAGGIAPELGLDPDSLALPDSWHSDLAAKFRAAGLACAAHLPFMGVSPADTDPAKREQARATLRRGATIAAMYDARHMVGHPYFLAERDGLSGTVNPAWLEYGVEAWRDIPDIGQAPLFLENVWDKVIFPITSLVAALHAARGHTAPLDAPVGVCLDIGHWHAFAGFSAPAAMTAWLDMLVPFRLHLHLHDNTGMHDDHLGLGQGDIPLETLFEFLEARNKAVTATMEPHTVEAFMASASWLERHPKAAERVGWRGANTAALPLAEMQKALAT